MTFGLIILLLSSQKKNQIIRHHFDGSQTLQYTERVHTQTNTCHFTNVLLADHYSTDPNSSQVALYYQETAKTWTCKKCRWSKMHQAAVKMTSTYHFQNVGKDMLTEPLTP